MILEMFIANQGCDLPPRTSVNSSLIKFLYQESSPVTFSIFQLCTPLLSDFFPITFGRLSLKVSEELTLLKRSHRKI